MRIAIALCGLALIFGVGALSLVMARRRTLTRDLEEIKRAELAMAAEVAEVLSVLREVDIALTRREERDSLLP